MLPKRLQARVPRTCLPCLCVCVCVCVLSFSCLLGTNRAAIFTSHAECPCIRARGFASTQNVHACIQASQDTLHTHPGFTHGKRGGTCQANAADSHIFSSASWHAWIHNMQRCFTWIHGRKWKYFALFPFEACTALVSENTQKGRHKTNHTWYMINVYAWGQCRSWLFVSKTFACAWKPGCACDCMSYVYDSVNGDIVFVFAGLHMFKMLLTELFMHVFWSCMCHA